MTQKLGPFTKAKIDADGDSKTRRSMAVKVLMEEIDRRFPVEFVNQSTKPSLIFQLRIDESIRDLGTYRLSTRAVNSELCVVVAGKTQRALLFGVGKLLRSIRFGPDGITVPHMDLEMSPTHLYRGHEVSTYKYRDHWQKSDWEEYIREIALWGSNWIWSASLVASPLEGCSQGTRELWERHCSVQNLQARIAESYGLKFGIHSYPNNIAQDTVAPDIDRGGGTYVCPSTSKGRHLILMSRKMLFEKLERVDAIFTASHDPGGCPCTDCSPWVETYVPLMKEQAELARRCHPGVEFYISNQALSREENLWLFDYLRQDRPDWLDGVVWGPQARTLSELRRALPKRYSILAFPDITHQIICQYPVEGFDQANALVHYRESPTYRPMAMKRIFMETKDLSIGSKPYSEGLHDDVNKAVWSALHWGTEPAEAVEEYCRWHFGKRCEQTICQAIFDLERNWRIPVRDNTRIAEVLDAIERISPKVVRVNRGNWRFDMLLLRCLIDYYVQIRLLGHRSLESRVLHILGDSHDPIDQRIDSGLQVIKNAGRDNEETQLARRIKTIGRGLLKMYGIKIVTVDRLGTELSNLSWMDSILRRAKATRSMESKQKAISKIIKYEAVGEGGYYDDCGNIECEPHLVVGEDYFMEDLEPDTRLSQRSMSHGRWQRDADIVYRYEGLNQDGRYRVSVTYLTNKRMRGSQVLLANGKILHDDLKVPEGSPTTLEFNLWPGIMNNGVLELVFRRGSTGRGPLVSEIRLQRIE